MQMIGHSHCDVTGLLSGRSANGVWFSKINER